jgi:hypothetical protein
MTSSTPVAWAILAKTGVPRCESCPVQQSDDASATAAGSPGGRSRARHLLGSARSRDGSAASMVQAVVSGSARAPRGGAAPAPAEASRLFARNPAVTSCGRRMFEEGDGECRQSRPRARHERAPFAAVLGGGLGVSPRSPLPVPRRFPPPTHCKRTRPNPTAVVFHLECRGTSPVPADPSAGARGSGRRWRSGPFRRPAPGTRAGRARATLAPFRPRRSSRAGPTLRRRAASA